MQIAVVCPFITPLSIGYAEGVIEHLMGLNIPVIVDKTLYDGLEDEALKEQLKVFSSLDQTTDFLICIGGDGSMLQAITKVKDSGVPILGINTGRLGFLTSLQKESLNKGLQALWEKKYSLIERTILKVELDQHQSLLEEFPYALNEISVSRKDTASLISVKASINNQELTTYWADGLIVATPTGSTGYNLSSGGPIVLPDTPALMMTPIAPHNLNIRPLVLPDHSVIELEVSGREEQHLLSLDSRLITLPHNTSIRIKKAHFSIATIQFDDTAFYSTLREKLFWGLDKRN
ncbi:MAG: NAD kinase [Flavobacteriaceae bacterium]